MHCLQRAVSRKRGCMPADSFVRIWKFIARPNLCGTPACVKPPPRCAKPKRDRAIIGKYNESNKNETKKKKKNYK